MISLKFVILLDCNLNIVHKVKTITVACSSAFNVIVRCIPNKYLVIIYDLTFDRLPPVVLQELL